MVKFERFNKDFGTVLLALKSGRMVSRAGWPSGMVIFLVNGSTFQVSRPPLGQVFPIGTVVDYQPHIDILIPSGESLNKTIQVWTPTTEDILAEDWEIYSRD